VIGQDGIDWCDVIMSSVAAALQQQASRTYIRGATAAADISGAYIREASAAANICCYSDVIY